MIGIKDADMPCDCWDCDYTYENIAGATMCIFTRTMLYPMGTRTEKDKDCPLVEINDEDAINR